MIPVINLYRGKSVSKVLFSYIITNILCKQLIHFMNQESRFKIVPSMI